MRGPVVDDKIQRNYITLTNHYSTIHLPFTTYILHDESTCVIRDLEGLEQK